ncbi:MAG TPA: thiamine phosphate synthase, partial [Arcobacter sp.]|nr:thiamine phosphate synthase [Arcobacter sp.]
MQKVKLLPKQIYALCDWETLQKKQISLETYLEICSKYDTAYIQYRDKNSSIDIQKKNLMYLKNNTIIPIIINDNLELLEYADGLHFGQEDLKLLCTKFNLEKKDLLIKLLKKRYPNKIFGLSTHNEKEILEANSFELDYIGLGAYRQTNTKDVSTILGD